MEYVKIGKITTTHGLIGEVKVKSDFKYKESIYIKDETFFLGKEKKPYHLEAYRKANEYDLLTFKEISDIDKAKTICSYPIYIKRESIKENLIEEDLIGFKAYYKSNYLGVILKITNIGMQNYVITIKTEKKNIYIPYQPNFIKKIDKKSAIIDFMNLEGLI